jgi:hypothetical protein
MASELSHSELAAKIVEGCIMMVAGDMKGSLPMDGIPLSELERAELGLAQGGRTAFYPLKESGVFLDLNRSTCSVFFADYDFDRALPVVEAALKRAYPRAKLIKDGPHPSLKDYRFRAYEIDLGGGKLALVELDTPGANASKRKFVARVDAQARKN